MITIFIGYDLKEPVAYHVCANSIIRRSSLPVAFVPLALSMLPYSETHADGSNQFVYSRFLIPYLQQFKGWAIFIDGDMIVKEDIVKLWKFLDNSKAVIVVKHDYTSNTMTKYLNSKNENYPRKNWSSVVLWNCAHADNKILTPEFIQKSPGSLLHRFQWIPDSNIGELPIEWNWLADEFGENENANIIHYTLGTPCFDQYKYSPMSLYWHAEYQHTTYNESST